MSYIPARGDIVRADFDPQAGREQAGRRPALVLPRELFNSRSGLALCCPITGRQKGYPFEVPLHDNLDVYGTVLADHLKSIDWRVRKVEFAAKAPDSVLNDVIAKLNAPLR